MLSLRLSWSRPTVQRRPVPRLRSQSALVVASRLEDRDRAYSNWLALPIQPGAVRRTLRKELVPGVLWSFEQA